MKTKRTTTPQQPNEADIPAVWQAAEEGEQPTGVAEGQTDVAQAPAAAPDEPKATGKATRSQKTAHKVTQPATKATRKGSKPAKKATAKKTPTPREGSKKDIILALVSRKKGASLEEIMEATNWQKHSVRGAITTMGKTIKIESSKSKAGARTYKAG